MRRLPKLPLVVVAAAAVVAGAAACGSKGISSSAQPRAGAYLFAQRCAGCHTLSEAGTEGSGNNVRTKLRTQGPNLDQRRETPAAVLFAIRNGGFSGAIMPQNIVVGSQATAVADFVAKYAGSKAKQPPSPAGGQGATSSP
jgi:mono/diheme cytochrome c family protein